MQDTAFNPVAVLFLFGACAVMLFASRQAASKAILMMAAFVPLGQQVVLLGLHFTFLRILIAFGALRILSRGEAQRFRWQTLDRLFILWVFVVLLCGILRGPKTEMFGHAYDGVGIFLLFRLLVRD